MDTAKNKIKYPPGPRLPKFIQMFLIMYWPLGYLNYCLRKYGRVFTARSYRSPALVVIVDPPLVKEALRAPYNRLHAYPGNEIFYRLLGEHSFVFKDDDAHRQAKKPALQAFARASEPDLVAMISRVAREDMEHWPRGKEFKLYYEMKAITLRSALKRVIGFTDEADERELVKDMNPWGSALRGPLDLLLFRLGTEDIPRIFKQMLALWPGVRRGQILERAIDQAVRKTVAAKSQLTNEELEIEGTYLARAMLAKRKNNELVNLSELVSNVKLLIITGHESAAITVSWLIWELHRRPDLIGQVRHEVDALDGVISCKEDISHMPLMDAVVMETLRLHPPVPVATRSAVTTYRVGDYLIPSGTTVLPCIYLLHRDPESWPDPGSFQPERFMDGKVPEDIYFPFGGGPHGCPGGEMGVFQTKCLAIEALRCFDFDFSTSKPPREKYLIAAVVPDNAMPVKVTERQHDLSVIRKNSDSVSAAGCPMHQQKSASSSRPRHAPD